MGLQGQVVVVAKEQLEAVGEAETRPELSSVEWEMQLVRDLGRKHEK